MPWIFKGPQPQPRPGVQILAAPIPTKPPAAPSGVRSSRAPTSRGPLLPLPSPGAAHPGGTGKFGGKSSGFEDENT